MDLERCQELKMLHIRVLKLCTSHVANTSRHIFSYHKGTGPFCEKETNTSRPSWARTEDVALAFDSPFPKQPWDHKSPRKCCRLHLGHREKRQALLHSNWRTWTPKRHKSSLRSGEICRSRPKSPHGERVIMWHPNKYCYKRARSEQRCSSIIEIP